MSIQDIRNKIKGVHENSLNILPISAIIILVGFGSFILGRLSVNMSTYNNNVSIIDLKSNLPIDSSLNSNSLPLLSSASDYNTSSNNQLGMYVASKNGKLYYTKGCKAADRLSEKTKISWNTREEAEGAGYTFAESCNK